METRNLTDSLKIEQDVYERSLLLFFEENQRILKQFAIHSLSTAKFKGDAVAEANDVVQDMYIKFSTSKELDFSKEKAEILSYIKYAIKSKISSTGRYNNSREVAQLEDVELADQNPGADVELQTLINIILSSNAITEEERMLLRMRFMEGMESSEIKAEKGYEISRQMIDVKIKAALDKLRKKFPELKRI